MTERDRDPVDVDAEHSYVVSDDMLLRFAQSTVLQRLTWLEEMRTFSWNAASSAVRARWRAARDRQRGVREG